MQKRIWWFKKRKQNKTHTNKKRKSCLNIVCKVNELILCGARPKKIINKKQYFQASFSSLDDKALNGGTKSKKIKKICIYKKKITRERKRSSTLLCSGNSKVLRTQASKMPQGLSK